LPLNRAPFNAKNTDPGRMFLVSVLIEPHSKKALKTVICMLIDRGKLGHKKTLPTGQGL